MSTNVTEQNTESALAARLRAERETRGWTLAQLATRSGVSRAMLSKIERGEASPTAALLGRLSAAFGLTLSQLFARVEDNEGGQIARAADQPVWRDPETGFVRRSVSPPSTSPMELVWGELPPGAEIPFPRASFLFMADQQLVIVSGELTIAQDGQTYDLCAGDCLRFAAADTSFRNRGAVRCRYIVAVLRHSEGGADYPRSSRPR